MATDGSFSDQGCFSNRGHLLLKLTEFVNIFLFIFCGGGEVRIFSGSFLSSG